jgi:Tol biopolymer transport system component
MKNRLLTRLLLLNFIFFVSGCTVSPPLPRPSDTRQTPTTQMPAITESTVPFSPVPSPSPKPEIQDKIAFMSNRDGFWDIYIMNADGSEQTRLTHDEMKGPFAFSVSPDSKKIAYISDKSGNPDLWVIDIITKETLQITNTEEVEEGSPAWSSDGENIVFHSNANNVNLYQIIEVEYPIKNKIPKFQLVYSDGTENALHPVFSPNGTNLLYSLVDSNGATTLHIYNFFNKKDSVITKKEEQGINGSWSPDGNTIIYWTNSNGIFRINPDGTGSSQIGTIKNIKGTPYFSPDGKKIIISRGFGFSEDYDAWIIDSDGRNPKKLTTLGGISLGWIKNSSAKAATDNRNFNPPVSNSPFPAISSTPVPASSPSSYIDPNDPGINP